MPKCSCIRGKGEIPEKAVEEKKSLKISFGKNKDEVVAKFLKPMISWHSFISLKKYWMKVKKGWISTRKTADKALGYGLITPYDHKKIELAQATLNAKW
jgi:hypothetical protein